MYWANTAKREAEETSAQQHQESARQLCAAVLAAQTLEYDPSNSRPRLSASPTINEEEGGEDEDEYATDATYLSFIGADGQVDHTAEHVGEDPMQWHRDVLSEIVDRPSPVGGQLLLFSAMLGRKRGKVMIDTGATGLFISEKSVRNLKLKRYAARTPTKVYIADGSHHECNHYVQVPLAMKNYATTLEMAVLPMDLGVDVILGTPWLQTLDGGAPRMNFIDMTLQFTHRGHNVKLVSTTAKMVAPGVTLKMLRRLAYCPFDQITGAQAEKDIKMIMKINTEREAAGEDLIEVLSLELGSPDLGIPAEARYVGTTGKAQCPTCWRPMPCNCSRASSTPTGDVDAGPGTGEPQKPPAAPRPATKTFKLGEQLGGEQEEAKFLEEFKDILADSLSEVRDSPGYEEAVKKRPRATVRTQHHETAPFRRAYKMSATQLQELRKQLDDLMAKGYIRPSSSPYGAPVLLVPKPHCDNEWRLVIDYRGINEITIRSRYPIPNVSQLMDELQGSTVFSTLDMLWGFWQLPMHPDDMEKTAMQTAYGSFEWTVLPMGLTNSPAIYQSWMHSMLGHLPFVKIFIDDILIHSAGAEEHAGHLRQVLEVLRDKKVVLKKKKANLFKTSVEFLGHVLTDRGLMPQHNKVKAVEDWHVPRDAHEIRQFLGLAGFYRQYIYNFADKSKAMNNLLKKGAEYEWSIECQDGFEAIKAALSSAPVLALPDQISAKDGKAPFVLQTDASDFALGGVLMQDTGDGLRPIAFESRSLNAAEQNYSTTEKELLAMIHCCRLWRHYFEDSKWVVQGDHRPLQWLFEPGREMTRRQARWIGILQEMGAPRITHVPGVTIPVPDALSRKPWLPKYKAEDGLVPGATRNAVDRFRTREVSDLLSRGSTGHTQCPDCWRPMPCNCSKPMNAWRHSASQDAVMSISPQGMAWMETPETHGEMMLLGQELGQQCLEEDVQVRDQQLHQLCATMLTEECSPDMRDSCRSVWYHSRCGCKEAKAGDYTARPHFQPKASGCEQTRQIVGEQPFKEGMRPSLYTIPDGGYPDYDNQDWRLVVQEFHRWSTLLGGYDVDACCDALGRNKMVSEFWSKDNSCLDNSWTGKRVWCNPPYTLSKEFVLQVIAHFKMCWSKHPEKTSATFVLPEWDGPSAPWRAKMEGWGFVAIHTYPADSSLFTSPGNDVPCRTKWPVTVWHHPPLRLTSDPHSMVASIMKENCRRDLDSRTLARRNLINLCRTRSQPVKATPDPVVNEEALQRAMQQVDNQQKPGVTAWHDPTYVDPKDDISCEVCDQTNHETQMLLCDGCEKGYHTYCLKPKLKDIPRGAWYCPACKGSKQRPREKAEVLTPEQEARLTVLDKFKRAYARDHKLSELRALYLADPKNEKVRDYRVLGDLLWRVNTGRYQLVVPEEAQLREWALSQAHDAVGCGHLGRDKTYEKLNRRFFWWGMGQDVTAYCSTCLTCQFSKKRKHRPDGFINPLPVPQCRWQVVTVDFVTGLPLTARGHNAIATFTDKLSKMVHLVSYKFNDSSAINVAKMYVDNIWRLHGAPMQIVCDRDPRLVSQFFKDFNKLLGTKVSPTTAFHPQGDGQSENTNQTMEQILRTLVEPHQRNWDSYLSQVEYAMNDSCHAVHGFTPFQLNYGESARNTLDWVMECQRGEPVANFQAQRMVEEIQRMVERTKAALTKANAKTAERSKKHRRDVFYREGDRVILSTKNLVITTDKGTKAKLRKPFCGPFTVTEVFKSTDGRPHAYKLSIPTHWRCHAVFKTHFLEPYLDGSYLFPGRVQVLPPVPTLLDNGETYSEVEKIVADRITKVRRGNRTLEEKQWLTRFKGEGPVGDLWLPIERLSDELGQCEEWVLYEKSKANLAGATRTFARGVITQETVEKLDDMSQVVQERLQTYLCRREAAVEDCSFITAYEEEHRVDGVLTMNSQGVFEIATGEAAKCPRRIRALVLFCGTGSVEMALHKKFPACAEIITVDNTPKWTPTHCVDILSWANPENEISYAQYPKHYFDIIWASPPCEEYSQAHTTSERKLDLADRRVEATLRIVDALDPTYWFIENPKSYNPVGLAYRPCMRNMESFRHQCTYCMYGALYKKPTNIWTNAPGVQLEYCSKATPCKHLKKSETDDTPRRHPETAQAGPTKHQAGSGGSSNVYPIPPKLSRELFRNLEFGRVRR